jgi:hypothetical protein
VSSLVLSLPSPAAQHNDLRRTGVSLTRASAGTTKYDVVMIATSQTAAAMDFKFIFSDFSILPTAIQFVGKLFGKPSLIAANAFYTRLKFSSRRLGHCPPLSRPSQWRIEPLRAREPFP